MLLHRRRRSAAGSKSSAIRRERTTVLSDRLKALHSATEAREVHLLCSGMHTLVVRRIVDQLCQRGCWVAMPYNLCSARVQSMVKGYGRK